MIAGTACRRVLRAEETYMTAAGPVRVERALYKDRTDAAERAVVPMELNAGIVGGFWTPTAARQAAWVVSQMMPQIAEEMFARVGNITPSKSSLDRLPKVLAERWDDDKTRFEKTLRDAITVPEEAVTVMASLDGVLAPMKDGEAVEKRAETATRGQIAKGPAGYREVGCATLSFCDKEGKCVAAVRMARMTVIRSLVYLRDNHPRSERIATELGYFRKRRHRMRYAEMKAQGLPIGTGAMEAACKTLVTQRLKQSGMRWSHKGGQAILNLRGWAQSERFDQAWALLAATYHAEIALLNDVVSIKTRRL